MYRYKYLKSIIVFISLVIILGGGNQVFADSIDIQIDHIWKRYDDTHPNISYEGIGWYDYKADTEYNGSCKGNPNRNVSVKFNFTGDKIRIISPKCPEQSTAAEVYIDGKLMDRFSLKSNTERQAIVFEVTNLEDGEHSLEYRFVGKNIAAFDAVDIDKEGEILKYKNELDSTTIPEDSWKRYDDTHPNISYEGKGWYDYENTTEYNGSCKGNPHPNVSVKFNFTGDKIRIISPQCIQQSTAAEVYIDGKLMDRFSLNSNSLRQAIVFEVTSLEDGEHSLEYRFVGYNIAAFDAVDIDKEGEILKYNKELDNTTIPEDSWKRYDDTHPNISYEGEGWYTYNYPTEYGGSCKGNPNRNVSVKFNFTGDKIRIISPKCLQQSTEAEVYIDGKLMDRFRLDNESIRQAIVFEVTNLEDGEHSLEYRFVGKNIAAFDAVDIDKEGEILKYKNELDSTTIPEDSWKRYDDTHPNISYEGKGWYDYENTTEYNGSCKGNPHPNVSVKFNFTGDKIRIISPQCIQQSTAAEVYIDGKLMDRFSLNSNSLRQAIVFEVTSLEDGEHSLEYRFVGDNIAAFDAVDIDNEGEILRYR